MSETYRIGLDVGGTKVLGAIFDEERNIVFRLKKKSTEQGAEAENVAFQTLRGHHQGSGLYRTGKRRKTACGTNGNVFCTVRLDQTSGTHLGVYGGGNVAGNAAPGNRSERKRISE